MSQRHDKFFEPGFPIAPAQSPFFYGWVIVLASTVGTLSTIPGQTAGTGPFKESLMAALQLHDPEISGAYGVGTCVASFLLPFMGKLFDRYGARVLTFYTQAAFGLCLIMLAFSGNIYDFLRGDTERAWWIALPLMTFGYFTIRLLGQGTITMASRALIGKWFNYGRARATAISGTFASVGFASSPYTLALLISATSWKDAYLILGSFMILAMVPFCWLLYRDNPEECGLEMDNGKLPKKPPRNADEFIIHKEYTQKEALRTYSFWVFTLGICLLSYFGTAISFHVRSIPRELGMAYEDFTLLFMVGQPLTIVLGFTLSWISNLIRLKYILMLMIGGVFASSIGVTLLPSALGTALFVGGNALGWSGFGTLLTITFPRFYGRIHLGKISGWVMSALMISSAVSPFTYSLFHEFTGSYKSASITFAVMALLLFFGSFKADNPQRKLAPASSRE